MFVSSTIKHMPKQSAGILLYRINSPQTEVLLVHPGGPFNQAKDLGAWSIPKGEFTDEENALDAAKREFAEETGQPVTGAFIPLQPVKQKGGKMVFGWAVEGDLDTSTIVSNTFRMEYPYKSGKWITVPEVDRGEWFDFNTARLKINPAQVAMIDELENILTSASKLQ